MSKHKKRNCEPRPCTMCGTVFTPPHGNRKLCPVCREKQGRNLGFEYPIKMISVMDILKEYPITYDNPTDIEQYEYKLRKRNIERFRDRIVATGYAERQKAKTLEMVGRVKI